MSGLVLIKMQDGVCTITLNNPRKKNALSLEMLADLEQNLEHLQNDADIRAVILQGAEGSFSVGPTSLMLLELRLIRKLMSVLNT